MTTLKELKELDAKATKAPWKIKKAGSICNGEKSFFDFIEVAKYRYITFEGLSDHEANANAMLTFSIRNALPDLIRVIELAEEALVEVNEKSHFVPAIVQETLSEIRKLKGE